MPQTSTPRSSSPPELWRPGCRQWLCWSRAKGWPTRDVPTPHPGCPEGCRTSAAVLLFPPPHEGTAWSCSSARLWARFALAWIRHASSESVALTRGGSFTETTRTRRQVDLWSLGEMLIRAFWNSQMSGDVGVRATREVSLSWSIFFCSRQPQRVCHAPLW
jgi:hypothetical protein